MKKLLSFVLVLSFISSIILPKSAAVFASETAESIPVAADTSAEYTIDVRNMCFNDDISYSYYLHGIKNYYKTHDSKVTADIITNLQAAIDGGSLSDTRAGLTNEITYFHLRSEDLNGYRMTIYETGIAISYKIFRKIQGKDEYAATNDGRDDIYLTYKDINFAEYFKEYMMNVIKSEVSPDANSGDFKSVADFKSIYSVDIHAAVHHGTNVRWGLCSYKLDGVLTYAPYLSCYGYKYIGEFTEENTTHFDSSKWIGANGYYEGEKSDEFFDAEAKLYADKEYDVYDFIITIKAQENGKENTYAPHMSTISQSGSIKDYPAHEFQLTDAPVDFKTALTDRELRSINYNYTIDGKNYSKTINQSEFSVYEVEDSFKQLIADFPFTKIKQSKPDRSDSIMHFKFGFPITAQSKKGFAQMYFLKDVMYMTVSAENSDSELEDYDAVFTYDNPDTLKNIENLLTSWKTTPPKVTYTELDDPIVTTFKDTSLKYRISFNITLSEAAGKSFLKEVAENNKVKCTLSYYKASGNDNDMLTAILNISGNGKSFNLMGENRNEIYKFVTTKIGITNDTPIPNEPLEHGYITLDWNPDTYSIDKDMTVSIFSEEDVKFGESLTITDKTEMEDLLELKDTPIGEAPVKTQVFADVPPTHWAYRDIENFYYANIVRGVGEGMYAPEDKLTYEQFGILLKRLFNYNYENTEPTPAKRQDVIAELVNALKLDCAEITNDSILSDKFADAEYITAENANHIKIAAEHNIAQGHAGYLRPDDALTRAEAITLLMRGLKEVYGITDHDEPEYYRFKIMPESKYCYVSANNLSTFKIHKSTNIAYSSHPDNYEIVIRDNSRLEGQLLMQFGNDITSDTKLSALCIVDKDIYTIESTNFDFFRMRPSDDVFRADCYANIFKNGKLYKSDVGMRINCEYYSADNEGFLTIQFGGSEIHFEYAHFSAGKLPDTPEKQPGDIIDYEWADGRDIYAQGVKNIITSAVSSVDYADGYCNIDYNKDNTKIKISMNMTLGSIYPEAEEYKIELIEQKNLTDTDATGIFRIKKGDEILSEAIQGKISGLGHTINQSLIFTTDDNTWMAEFRIVEVVK